MAVGGAVGVEDEPPGAGGGDFVFGAQATAAVGGASAAVGGVPCGRGEAGRGGGSPAAGGAGISRAKRSGGGSRLAGSDRGGSDSTAGDSNAGGWGRCGAAGEYAADAAAYRVETGQAPGG